MAFRRYMGNSTDNLSINVDPDYVVVEGLERGVGRWTDERYLVGSRQPQERCWMMSITADAGILRRPESTHTCRLQQQQLTIFLTGRRAARQ